MYFRLNHFVPYKKKNIFWSFCGRGFQKAEKSIKIVSAA